MEFETKILALLAIAAIAVLAMTAPSEAATLEPTSILASLAFCGAIGAGLFAGYGVLAIAEAIAEGDKNEIKAATFLTLVCVAVVLGCGYILYISNA